MDGGRGERGERKTRKSRGKFEHSRCTCVSCRMYFFQHHRSPLPLPRVVDHSHKFMEMPVTGEEGHVWASSRFFNNAPLDPQSFYGGGATAIVVATPHGW